MTVDDTDVIELFGLKVLLGAIFSAIAIIVIVVVACVLIYLQFPGRIGS